MRPETLAIPLRGDSLKPSGIAPIELHKSKTPGPLVPPFWVRPPRGPNPTIRLAGELALFHIKNRVELMGFLGKSPESKSTKKTGRTLAILSLATKTWWKDKDEQPQEKTEWHRIIVWNGLAEYAADKLKKGDHLYVVGTLVSNVYEKEIGKGKNKSKAQITAWQIKAFSIRKLDRKETLPTAPATEKAPTEEIPF
ncbi:MAG: single-stranded DNA-binding protein [Candidatus Acidiferrum sp.]